MLTLFQGKEVKNRMQDFPFFIPTHRGCYVRRQVKHWDNISVEVDKGTQRLWANYPTPLPFFTPNKFKIIKKNIKLYLVEIMIHADLSSRFFIRH